jgi:hypothetical protein
MVTSTNGQQMSIWRKLLGVIMKAKIYALILGRVPVAKKRGISQRVDSTAYSGFASRAELPIQFQPWTCQKKTNAQT